jgi:3-oxoacyl-[acyl-carrier protein] reductase
MIQFDLKDKTALVTGGSRGIGLAVVRAFLDAGARVWYASRTRSGAHDELEAAFPGRISWLHCDVTSEAEATAAVDRVVAEGGRIDILVNNAGITKDNLFFRMSLEDWDAVLRTNLTSAFLFSKPVARQMTRQKSGSIVMVSSVVGLMGNGGQANYAASKAGLIGLVKSIAREIGSRGVRVNAIAPGFIETDMTAELSEAVREKSVQAIPLSRFGSSEDVAGAVLFLASDASTYNTGEVIRVDGGMGM